MKWMALKRFADFVDDALDAAGLTAPAWSVGVFALAVGAWTLRPLRPLAVGLGTVGAVGAAVTVIPRRPIRGINTSRTAPAAAESAPLRIAAANVWIDNRNPAAAIDEVLALNADVLVVSELNTAMHEHLVQQFPYAMAIELDAPGTNFAHGVYARYPLAHARHAQEIPGQAIVARVEAPEPFWLFALHLPRPKIFGPLGWGLIRPQGLRGAVDQVLALAEAKNEPVVIAGDLNLSDRTPGYRALVRSHRDVMRQGWARTTYGEHLMWKATMLRIDHLFVSRSWSATNQRRVTITGSDHQAIIADLLPSTS
jgi:endonuclease/exonuclease/phosphatase (EEP) superfamily protein YafD